MTATREKTFLLASPEARVLEWIARRLPRWVTPDHLTTLGVLAAVGIAAAYALSNRDPLWLWAASGLGLGVLDAAGVALAGLMLGALAVRAARNLRELARLEPQTAP